MKTIKTTVTNHKRTLKLIFLSVFVFPFVISFIYNAVVVCPSLSKQCLIEYTFKNILNISVFTIWLFIYFRWIHPTSETYIKEEVVPVKYTSPYMFLFRTRKGNLLITGNPFRGFLVIGGAGSGKSESIVNALIWNSAVNKFSGMVYDFKFPTLTQQVLHEYSEHSSNTPIHVVCFNDLTHSKRINPLRYVKNQAYAREYAQAVIKNLLPESIERMDFWTRSITDLLTAEIFYLSQEHPHLCTLPHVIAMNYQDEEKLIRMLCTNLECAGMVRSIEVALKNKSSNQLSGVFSTLQSALSRLNLPEIFWVLSGNDFDITLNNPDNPQFLCIGNDPELSDTYAPAISLIMTVALKQLNTPNRHPSIVIMDEAPTVFIPNIDRIPATARSNKVAFAYCAQDISQIVAGYGNTNAESIIGNLNNQFYGRVSNPKTAEHIVRLFGKEEKEVYSESRSTSSQGSSQSVSKSIQERNRHNTQEFLQLDTGEFAFFLVDSKHRDGIVYLVHKPSQFAPLPETHTDIDLKANFARIYDDVKLLFDTLE